MVLGWEGWTGSDQRELLTLPPRLWALSVLRAHAAPSRPAVATLTIPSVQGEAPPGQGPRRAGPKLSVEGGLWALE